MSDPNVPDAEKRKKIMFYESEERQTKLRVRCNFDGITQSQFFRMMVTGYIEHDELIFSFMDRYKEKHGAQGQQKRNKIKTIRNKTSNNSKKFSLDREEIEDIFDIIETETKI